MTSQKFFSENDENEMLGNKRGEVFRHGRGSCWFV